MTGEQYVRALRDRWRLVALMVLLGVVLAGAATFVVPKRYAASVDTFVLPAGATPDTTSAYEGGLLSQQRVKSYVQLFTGGRVSDVVVDRLGLPMTSTELTQEMSVSTQTDSVILSVGVEDPSPERAELIANTSAKVFQELVAQLEQPADARVPPATSVKIVAPAKLADDPAFPHRTLFLAAGAAIGLLAGIGLALWRNARGRPLRTADELREVLDVPALGSVLKSTQTTPLLPAEFSPEMEALRQVRTALQFAAIDHPRKVVLVTSAVPGEGKTRTSCQLASALASAGHRVLLVDADLRRSGASELAGMDRTVGVTTVLTHRISLEEAVTRHALGFDFLASGRLPHNPSELTASAAMGSLLDRLGKRYEYVLLDSAPLLPVTDAATLAGQADGVIMLCRSGSTLDTEVRHAARILDTVGANVWGSLLTMVPHRGPGGRSYGYYHATAVPEPPAASPEAHLETQMMAHQTVRTNGHRAPRPRPTSALPPAAP